MKDSPRLHRHWAELEESRGTAFPLGLCLGGEPVRRRLLPACLSRRQMPSPGVRGPGAAGALKSNTQADGLLSNGLAPGTGLGWDLTDFPGKGPRTLARNEEGAARPCLQLSASASVSLFFFAILGLSIPPALGSNHPHPLLSLSLRSLFSSPILSFLLPLVPSWPLLSEGYGWGPPSSQSVSPVEMFCKVSLL